MRYTKYHLLVRLILRRTNNLNDPTCLSKCLPKVHWKSMTSKLAWVLDVLFVYQNSYFCHYRHPNTLLNMGVPHHQVAMMAYSHQQPRQRSGWARPLEFRQCNANFHLSWQLECIKSRYRVLPTRNAISLKHPDIEPCLCKLTV